MEELNNLLNENYQLLLEKKLPKSFRLKDKDSPLYWSTLTSQGIIPWKILYNKNIGYTLYSEDWIKPLSEWLQGKKCLEIMAGTGYLSYFLSQFGINVIATDNFDYKELVSKQIYPIEKLDYLEAIKKYGKDVDIILCVCPTDLHNEVQSALKAMKENNPNCQMIYIGERRNPLNQQIINTLTPKKDTTFSNVTKNYKSWLNTYNQILLLN